MKVKKFTNEIFFLITNIISHAHDKKSFISDPKALLHQQKHGKFMSEYTLTEGNATAMAFKHDINAVYLCAAQMLKKKKPLCFHIYQQ